MSRRTVKINMWEKNPHCHWCGIPTVLTNLPHGILPNNAATIDHLYSRYTLKRWVHRDGRTEPSKVLSCYKCNHDRGNRETAMLSKEEKRKRGKGMAVIPKRTFRTINEIIQYLKENGLDISENSDTITI